LTSALRSWPSIDTLAVKRWVPGSRSQPLEPRSSIANPDVDTAATVQTTAATVAQTSRRRSLSRRSRITGGRVHSHEAAQVGGSTDCTVLD
jgi:hypothetical protein